MTHYKICNRNIRDKKRRNYAACATAMDDSIGQVVDLYKEHGNVSQTSFYFVIILSPIRQAHVLFVDS